MALGPAGQDHAGRSRAPEDGSGPHIRSAGDKAGPRETDESPQDEVGPAGRIRALRNESEPEGQIRAPMEESGPRKMNQGAAGRIRSS